MANSGLCSIPNCGKPLHGSKWCQPHYRKYLKYGDPLGKAPKRAKPRGLCSLDGCSKPEGSARGLCHGHYGRFLRYGSPVGGGTPSGSTGRFIDEVALRHEGPECLMWPYSRDRDGYGKAYYWNKGVKASRVVCVLAHGEPPSEVHEAAHSCGNSRCVNPKHLRWATPLENTMDKFAHGSIKSGETHPKAKLTRDSVAAIRRQYKTIPNKELANLYGVSPTTIFNVGTGKYWIDD